MLRHLLPPALLSLLASCGQPATQSPPRPVVTITSPVPSATPVASASASPPSEPSAKPEELSPKSTPPHKVALTLKPGEPPCTLVLEGKSFEDQPEWFVIRSVTRMATEESGGCAASVFYDLSKETKKDPNDMDPEPLVAGGFPKTEKPLPPELEGGPGSNLFEDLNFDGVKDLCVVVMTGAYNYSQKCYLFDTKSRVFVRHEELDDLIYMRIDRVKKKIANGFRAGGPVYEDNEYEWRNGKLVQTLRVVSYLGEKPNGTLLDEQFNSWRIKYELRNGKLVKTFDGPIRAKR